MVAVQDLMEDHLGEDCQGLDIRKYGMGDNRNGAVNMWQHNQMKASVNIVTGT